MIVNYGDRSNLIKIDLPLFKVYHDDSLYGDGTKPSPLRISAASLLPSQTSNSGKFLTTDGSTTSWATVTLSADSVTNAMLSDMATLTLKGNNTGGAANPIDLSVSQVNAMLGTVTGTTANTQVLVGSGTSTFASSAGLTYTSPYLSTKVSLAAGTASASTAPLKLTSGTLNTTAEGGAEEYNGVFYETKASGLRYAKGGVIADFYADVNNSGTTETDLYTYTTPASTLAVDGGKITAQFCGTFNDVTATSQLKVYFGGTTIANTGALTVSATGGWLAQVTIIRTGATTARAVVNISTPGASTAVYTSETDLTGLTLSATNILKITGQAGGGTGGSNDITAKLGTISYFGPAAN